MEKYIPLALALFLTMFGIYVEHSICESSRHATMHAAWMISFLEYFVFCIWALGMFVIGAIYQDFSREEISVIQKVGFA